MNRISSAANAGQNLCRPKMRLNPITVDIVVEKCMRSIYIFFGIEILLISKDNKNS